MRNSEGIRWKVGVNYKSLCEEWDENRGEDAGLKNADKGIINVEVIPSGQLGEQKSSIAVT